MPLGGPKDDIGTAIVESRDGGYVLAGITSSFGAGAEDVWLVKLMADDNDRNTSGNATSWNAMFGSDTSRNSTTSENTTSILIPENASKNITNQKISDNTMILDIPKLAGERMPALSPGFPSAKMRA